MAVILGAWTVVALLSTSQGYLRRLMSGEEASWWVLFLTQLTVWYPWALATPLIFWLGRKFPLERKRLLLSVPTHVVLGTAIVMTFVAYHALVILPLEGEYDPQRAFLDTFLMLLGWTFYLPFMLYWAILCVGLAVGYYGMFREREAHATELEVRASQLQTRLARAHLHALRMQLQPHFLFNTLHAISALMDEDVRGARRMIARLSELLRLTLEQGGRSEVTLREELELIDRYLDIEEVRFQDRLRVQRDVDPEALEAEVPSLILQPLVENAIRHGIWPHAQAGLLEIRAAREDGMLRLQIRDDGPGIHEDRLATLNEGIGLSNTRERLRQAYGDASEFRLENAAEGGLRVTLILPFQARRSES